MHLVWNVNGKCEIRTTRREIQPNKRADDVNGASNKAAKEHYHERNLVIPVRFLTIHSHILLFFCAKDLAMELQWNHALPHLKKFKVELQVLDA